MPTLTTRRALARFTRLNAEPLEERLMLSSVPPTVVDVNVASSQWSNAFVNHLETEDLGNGGFSIPVGSSAQLNTLPWRDIDTILITFSEDVSIRRQDLSITGVTNFVYAVDSFYYDPATLTASWTLAAPFANSEKVHLDLDGSSANSVADLNGNALDGDWTDGVSTYASGNGSAGGDFEFRFNVLRGDAISSNDVDDYDVMYTYYSQNQQAGDPYYNITYDIDGNGVVDDEDLTEVYEQYGETLATGTPLGATSDAPSTSGFDLEYIDNRAVDYVLSLYDFFDDAEDPDSSMTYAVESQSNAALLDSVAINASTGALTVNAVDSPALVGRNEIVVSATDSAGLVVDATLTVDVEYVNQPPVISAYHANYLGLNTWEVTGNVSDADDDVVGMIVDLTGIRPGRAVVQTNGAFHFYFILESSEWGYESATVTDPHDAVSTMRSAFVGLT